MVIRGAWSRLALYSAGALGASLLLQTILVWLVYFYAPPGDQGSGHLPPTLVGIAMAAGRIANAVSNPLVAFWSDRLQSRWGRRRPFILAGAPALCAFFILLWTPPPAPPSLIFVYLVVTLIGFFSCFSLVMNPYAALLPDITPRGKLRVEAASWQAGASLAGVGATFLVSPWLIAHHSFSGMGLSIGLVALAALGLVGLALQEPPGSPSAAAPSLKEALAAVARHRAFVLYLTSLTLLWLGTSMVNSTVVFIITVLMGLPRNDVGIVLAVSFACTLMAFPTLGPLARRWSPPRTMKWTLAASALILPCIGAIGLPRVPIAPSVQGYVLIALVAPPLAALLVLPNAILADIAETNRLRGKSHEAMFYALQGLVLNGATAGASIVLGVLLSLGDSPGHTLGLRLIPATAGICTALAYLVFQKFPEVNDSEGLFGSGVQHSITKRY